MSRKRLLLLGAGVPIVVALTFAVRLNLSFGFINYDIDGRHAEELVVAQLGPFITSSFPNAKVSKATCPDQFDVSNGQAGHCMLMVDGSQLPVHVLFDAPPDQLKAGFDGTIYQRTDTNHWVETTLLDLYSLHAKVDCDMLAFSAQKPGSLIQCNVAGAPSVSAVQIETGQGKLKFSPPLALPQARRGRPQ